MNKKYRPAFAAALVLSIVFVTACPSAKSTPAGSASLASSVPAAQQTSAEANATNPSNTTSSIPESSTHDSEVTSINYSELHFAETKAVEYPSELSHFIIDEIPPLTDFLLSNSEVVIKATITEIHFNDYSDNYYDTSGSKPYAFSPNSIVYTVTIDKIYYVMAGLTISIGDTFTIEESLWAESPCMKDPECQLQWNRQYILPLSYDSMKKGYTESPYSLEYSNMPQIECTEDGGYVFYAQQPLQPYEFGGKSYSWFGWGELINADTLPIVMDLHEPEGLNESWKEVMHFRMDSQFEEDFQSLCDRWCLDAA